MNQIDLFCYTKGPGNEIFLEIGYLVLKTLSVIINKPIMGVNNQMTLIEYNRFKIGLKILLF